MAAQSSNVASSSYLNRVAASSPTAAQDGPSERPSERPLFEYGRKSKGQGGLLLAMEPSDSTNTIVTAHTDLLTPTSGTQQLQQQQQQAASSSMRRGAARHHDDLETGLVGPEGGRGGTNSNNNHLGASSSSSTAARTSLIASSSSPTRGRVRGSRDDGGSRPRRQPSPSASSTGSGSRRGGGGSGSGGRQSGLKGLTRTAVEQEEHEPISVVVFKWALILAGSVMLGAVIYIMGEVIVEWISKDSADIGLRAGEGLASFNGTLLAVSNGTYADDSGEEAKEDQEEGSLLGLDESAPDQQGEEDGL